MAAHFNDRIDLCDGHFKVAIYAGAQRIGVTHRALRLSERGYPPRYYLPRDCLTAAGLVRSGLRTHCPYKGDADYYHLVVAAEQLDEAAWCYPAPRAEMAAIAGLVAFDHPRLGLDGAAR